MFIRKALDRSNYTRLESEKIEQKKIDITRESYIRQRRLEKHRDEQAVSLHEEITTEKEAIDNLMKHMADFSRYSSDWLALDLKKYQTLIAQHQTPIEECRQEYERLTRKYDTTLFSQDTEPQLANNDTEPLLQSEPTVIGQGAKPQMVSDVTKGYIRRGPEWWSIGRPWSHIGRKARNRAEYDLHRASNELKELRKRLEKIDSFVAIHTEEYRRELKVYHIKIENYIKEIEKMRIDIENLNRSLLVLPESNRQKYQEIIHNYDIRYKKLIEQYTVISNKTALDSEILAIDDFTAEHEQGEFSSSIGNMNGSDLHTVSIDAERLRDGIKEICPLAKQCIEGHRKIELQRSILQNAIPELSKEGEKAYQKLEELHREANYPEANDGKDLSKKDIRESFQGEHTQAIMALIKEVSPEILEFFEKYGIKVVTKQKNYSSRPKAGDATIDIEKNNECKWEIQVFTPYRCDIKGMLLRIFDAIPELCHVQRREEYANARNRASSANTTQEPSYTDASPEFRAKVTTWIYLANKRLGKHGFSHKGYKQAERYHEDFKEGIINAFNEKQIDINTPKEELIQIGQQYALNKFIDRIRPQGDIPQYPNMRPGAYFQEMSGGVWQLNEGQRPVVVGFPEFDQLMDKLMERKDKGNNFTLNISLMPDKQIIAQPFYPLETDQIKSHHQINTEGDPCEFSGEADIEIYTDPDGNIRKKLLRLRDRSGHYKTFDPANPYVQIRAALKAFQEQGFDTSKTLIELRELDGETQPGFYNYVPRTLENPQDDALTREQRLKINSERMGPL